MIKYEDLTKEQICNILDTNMKDKYMRWGYNITRFCDTSSKLCDLFVIGGCDEIFDNEEEAIAKAKEMFLESVENSWKDKKLLKTRYCIAQFDAHEKHEGRLELYYEEGLRVLGQSFVYWATKEITNARWFDSLDEVAEFLKSYTYNDEVVIVTVPIKSLWKKEKGTYLI
jgi:hypothetical protein